MDKHTPAPWSINDWPQDHSDIRIGAKGTPLIASVHLRDESINGQQANANLIANAPALLHALEALEYIASVVLSDISAQDTGSFYKLQELAQKASIAARKARGEL